MKVIYIAGKYRDKRGEFYVSANIQEAAQNALYVWLNGGVAICPHKNTAFFGGAFGITDETWLDGDIELLSRCDAVWAIPSWESSEGAKEEVEFARAHNIPVLFNQSDVYRFLRGET